MRYFNIIAGILHDAPNKPKKGDIWKAYVYVQPNLKNLIAQQATAHIAMVATVMKATSDSITIAFDGNSDDVLLHGFLMPTVHMRLHSFGSIRVTDNMMQTAVGETDASVPHEGNNQKWSLKRG